MDEDDIPGNILSSLSSSYSIINNNNTSMNHDANDFRTCFKNNFLQSFALYEYIHFGLAVSYGIICLLCILHFCFKLYNSHNQLTQSTWHNWFYPLLFIGSAARGVMMIFMYMPPEHSTKFFLLLSFTPSFIFFSAYLIILFRWAQIYHNSYEMTSLRYDHLRIIFYVTNLSMYIIVIGLLVADLVKNTTPTEKCLQSNNPLQYTISTFCSALYILTPLGFVIYTFRITRKFRYLPSKSPAKKEVSRRLQRFTVLVIVVFFCRAVLVLYSNISVENISVTFPWFDGVYYFLLEIIPLALMFAILRMHSSKGLDSNSGPTANTPLINHTLSF